MASVQITHLDAYSHESITVSTTALGFTTTETRKAIAGTTQTVSAVEALITVETNPVRYTMDGTTPTANVGHLLGDGDVITISGMGNIKRFQMIRQGAADATVMVTYFA